MAANERLNGWMSPLVIVLLPLLLSCGVLPRELKALGSTRSVEYAARYLYVDNGIELELIWPRLGNPALLQAADEQLVIHYFSAEKEGLSSISASAASGVEVGLEVMGEPTCDDHGLCSLTVSLPPSTPADQNLTLCVKSKTEKVCQQGAIHRFAETPDPLRLAVLADIHFKSQQLIEYRRRMDLVFQAIEAADPPIHLVVMLGDLADEGELDETLGVVDAIRDRRLPVAVLPGNHDFLKGNIANYLLHINPRLDYEIRVGPYLLVALNTGPSLWEEHKIPLSGRNVGLDSEQLNWFSELTRSTDNVEVAMLHTPASTASTSRFRGLRREFLAVASDHGVQLILAGHTHQNEQRGKTGLDKGICQSNVAVEELPLSLTSAKSTACHGGFRVVTLDPGGGPSFCWVEVSMSSQHIGDTPGFCRSPTGGP
ncbi:MAG: hypothetical protein HN348_16705 [Proteobacteria bacterium]|nr:hypothetical protein [Pseudomonadota bacterium]